MGGFPTKQDCVDIGEIKKYTDEEYSVLRTNGDIDTQYILTTLHEFSYTQPCSGERDQTWRQWLCSHAFKTNGGYWRVFLQTKPEDKHICGWRDLSSLKFWPKRMETQEEKEHWRDEFIRVLEELEEGRRINLLPQNLQKTE